MKIAFAGTPEFAATALEALLAAGHEVALVLTQPDRPAGRGMQLQTSAVKQLALRHGLPLHQPERLKDPATHQPLQVAAVEVLVVAAYGLILPQAVLDIPRHGCLNIHASLLPRWRGAAPIHRAVEAGDSETGITIMQMDAGLDTGAMLLREAMTIGVGETTGELHDRLAEVGGRLIVDALAQRDQLPAQVQPLEGVTYANKVSKAEAQLDWNQPAEVLARKVCAFNPFPGANLVLAGTPVKVWRATAETGSGTPGQVLHAAADGIVAACSEGALRITELQKPGSRRATSADFLNGRALTQ